ncbi:MAG TPA: type IV toxin-antitoxin system AbiEi family antitoxin [Solirubrobacteraceae bacterium]|nr:type IV toxin-antitoxin system AbiEi family antitoxin [Solirubrobacteraceae bacterium]
MPANEVTQETELIDAAVAWLGNYLPPGWTAERSERQIVAPNSSRPTRLDAVVDLRGSNATATFAVEAKRSFSPRDVERLLPGLSRTLRSLAANVPLLVVAPWLSARTQELLRNEGINYIDLAGNTFIRLDFPAVFIRTTGATRNPERQARAVARVRGPKAGRLVRTLIDVRPPYGVRELAGATRLAPGYVSRLLDALDRDALVDRSPKGVVLAVDFAALLRRWTESYDVLTSNETRRFIAPEGAGRSFERLRDLAATGAISVTGSFAAVRLAPVAAPALLLLYVEDMAKVIDGLNLLPADEGANVVLLRPFDQVVWDRVDRDDGITYVAPSQAAADCLTGTGRMPSEGEALITWMTANEDRWRVPSLRALVETEPRT